MRESIQTTVVCQHPGDGSGDVIIDFHLDVIRKMNVGLGDSLSIELADGAMVLKPTREADAKS